MTIYMTSTEFDDLADFLHAKFAQRVKEEGASYSIRQMSKELGGDVSEETLRRLMNKRVKKRGLDIRTLRALTEKWGREVTDVLKITPRF